MKILLICFICCCSTLSAQNGWQGSIRLNKTDFFARGARVYEDKFQYTEYGAGYGIISTAFQARWFPELYARNTIKLLKWQNGWMGLSVQISVSTREYNQVSHARLYDEEILFGIGFQTGKKLKFILHTEWGPGMQQNPSLSGSFRSAGYYTYSGQIGIGYAL